jgi:hypothetical protein
VDGFGPSDGGRDSLLAISLLPDETAIHNATKKYGVKSVSLLAIKR